MALLYQVKIPPIVDFYEQEAPVNWADMNPKPYRALLQCTSGQFHKDSECETYIRECNENGIKYGLYHFLFPNNIDEQAQIYIERVTELGGLGHFPPVLDVEFEPPKQKPGHPDNLPRGKAWGDQIKVWLDAIEAHFNEKPMIYTSLNFWNFTHAHNNQPPTWSGDYPLWVAWYPRKKSIDGREAPRADRMPAGFTKWDMWQYSKSGRSDGFLASDYSIIHPDYKAILDARFPTEPPPAEQPPL